MDRFLVLAKFIPGFGGEIAILLSAVQVNNVDLRPAFFVGIILCGIVGIRFGLW